MNYGGQAENQDGQLKELGHERPKRLATAPDGKPKSRNKKTAALRHRSDPVGMLAQRLKHTARAIRGVHVQIVCAVDEPAREQAKGERRGCQKNFCYAFENFVKKQRSTPPEVK
jgi:hypothetical protein